MRVTDLRGVDLSRYRFDYGLTFSVLLMHPDGTVYHRYGARDQRSAGVWLGEASYASVLRETLAEHARYAAAPSPPPTEAPLRLEDVPAFAARDKGNCIHCHNVRPALYEDALAAGTWKASDGWFQPPPAQIGVDVAEAEQNVLTVVVPGSPADTAGLEVGERLLSLGGERILTAADLAWVLGTLSPDGGDVPFEVAGSGAPRSGVLALAPGWKKPSPLAFSWRPFRWALSPAPGFGGTALKDDAKAALGVAPGDLAFVVKRFFLGPDKARFAREAQRAGILQGDIIVAANGKRDFTTPEHFQTWWSLEHRAGDEIEVELLRDGRREVVRVRVVE